MVHFAKNHTAQNWKSVLYLVLNGQFFGTENVSMVYFTNYGILVRTMQNHLYCHFQFFQIVRHILYTYKNTNVYRIAEQYIDYSNVEVLVHLLILLPMVLKAPGLLSEVHIRTLEGMNAKKKEILFYNNEFTQQHLKVAYWFKRDIS